MRYDIQPYTYNINIILTKPKKGKLRVKNYTFSLVDEGVVTAVTAEVAGGVATSRKLLA